MEPELKKRYIEDGTLRLDWRDFPYKGEESRQAAVAARAAQEQGMFWEYHDTLYENQGSENSGAFSDDNLVEFARQAGLNVKQFEESFKSGKYKPVVDRDFREAQDAGIQGTPSFSINGQRLVGSQPLETFEQAIEEARQAENG
ncbi:MAG: thioredoxin domain-containing protein [Actinobacteria bacterium]|nr:thioredoxin domain-containing protein [Actinomycetota bacterium]